MNKDLKISHFYGFWRFLEKEAFLPAMQFAREGGIEHVTLDDKTTLKLFEDPELENAYAAALKGSGLKVFDVHAPCGPKYDLDIDGKENTAHMIDTHKKALQFSASLGAKTYTIHMGAIVWCRNENPLSLETVRENTLAALENLLPTAEKEGIIICCENSFEPVNTPDETLFYVRHFSSPYIGCCFDSGHANMMQGKGKDPGKYTERFKNHVWRGNFVFEDSALEKMAPYIVTCHLHDNNGYEDNHHISGSGNTDWDTLMEKISQCPNLLSIQNESDPRIPAEKKDIFQEKASRDPVFARLYARGIQDVFNILISSARNKNDLIREVIREMEKNY